jgi:hypothetical protein
MKNITVFKNRSIMKIVSVLIAAALALSIIPMTVFSVEGEGEAPSVTEPATETVQTADKPDVYLEITNTITAQDTFAWTEYDHLNYQEPYSYYSQYNLPKHISSDGNNIKMTGYCYDPLKDFLFIEDEGNSRKTFEFDIQRDSTDWHSMEGGGFLFNASIKSNTLQGFCVLITQSGLILVDISGIDLETFRNSGSVRYSGTVLGTYSIGDVYAAHHFKIDVDNNSISLWDGDSLIIDDYQLPENDYGFGYGPITSHASHGCDQQSYFTFSNIKMQTVTGYYLKVDETEDQWDLTNSYWTNTFTLSYVEYEPVDGVTITDFSEYPLFKNATDMLLFYPDGTYERIPWINGKADYNNAKRYIDILKYNTGVETRDLELGEMIVGTYSEQ